MSRFGIDKRDYPGTAATGIPGGRLVKINASEQFELCGSSDTNAVAVTARQKGDGGSTEPLAHLLSAQGRVEIEAANSVTAGDALNQAADGKCQAGAGTVRVGVAFTSGAAGEFVEVVPS